MQDERRQNGRLHDCLEAELADVEQRGPRLHPLVEQRQALVLAERAPAHRVAHKAQTAQRQVLARRAWWVERRVVAQRDALERAVVAATDREEALAPRP